MLRNRYRRALGCSTVTVGLVAISLGCGGNSAAIHRERTSANLNSRFTRNLGIGSDCNIGIACYCDTGMHFFLTDSLGCINLAIHDNADFIVYVL